MESIVDLHAKFYNDIMAGKRPGVLEELESKNIRILDGFTENQDLVRRFYREFYGKKQKRIVLCGINPGKLGAGKTGIPFIDFLSVSKFFPDCQRTDSERSAQFIYSIIDEFGVQEFFDRVYLTNISWFGFTRSGKNLNYHCLSSELQEIFTAKFREEMKTVQPSVIIPLGEHVEDSLKGMKGLSGMLAERLPHPNWASFPSKAEEQRTRYIETIKDASKDTEGLALSV